MVEAWKPPKSDAERLAELERRVRELEARPPPQPVYIYTPPPYYGYPYWYYPNWHQPPYYIGGGCVSGVGSTLVWQNENMGGAAQTTLGTTITVGGTN